MSARLSQLDHLVVVARTLEEGAAHVAGQLGAQAVDGGSHPFMGTHNKLLNLWGGSYLEIIACDPAAAAARPRWFGLDDARLRQRLDKHGPFLAHWVARVERPRSLQRWQRQYPERLAPVLPMTRGAFAWHITVPDDGALPGWNGAGDGIVPTLIQWDLPHHPAAALPATGIALKSLRGFHPRAEALRDHLRWLGAKQLIALETNLGEPALIAEFDTPDGVRTLK
jgi:hypothetical protein